MNNDWNYIGVFLDEASKEKLLEMFGGDIPDNWKPFCHHMTLAYNNGQQEPQMMYDNYVPRFGETVKLQITHLGISDRAMAVKVYWTDAIINNLPHITVATAPEAKPVESNKITNWNKLPIPVTISGKIGVFKKNR